MKLTPTLLLASMSAVTPAAAQLHSLPAYSTASVRPGWSFAADYGRDVDSPQALGQHVGGRAAWRLGRAALELGAGRWDSGTGAELQVAGKVGLTLLGGARSVVVLGLEVGTGYFEAGSDSAASSYLALPLGISLGFRSLTVAGKAVRPWLAPRVQANRVTFHRVVLNQKGFGASGGMRASLAGPLGVHGAVDWSWFEDRRRDGVTVFGGSRVSLGAGLHLHLGPRGGDR